MTWVEINLQDRPSDRFEELVVTIISQLTFKYRGVNPCDISDGLRVRVSRTSFAPLEGLKERGQYIIDQTRFPWDLNQVLLENGGHVLIFVPKNLLEMLIYA